MTPALHLLELDVRWPPESFLCWKLEGLAARGMRVSVASRAIDEPAAQLAGVDLLPLPQRGAPLGHTLAAIEDAVATLRPDVVHIEWTGSAIRCLPTFDRWRCPVVISCHGSHISANPHLPGYEEYAAVLPTLLRSANAVHCVSASLQRTVIGLGADPARAHVIRQGVDPSVFRPRPRAERMSAPLKVISVGWPRWIKGFEWALQAIRALIDEGVPVTLELVGAGGGEASEQARLVHTVEDLGLARHVSLEKTLASAEVAQRMSASDVLLLPSLDEGLPTVLLEAMACGLPAVASDCGGVSEALTDGVEGLLVPPRDAAAIAHALTRLWREPELRHRMGQAGRRAVTSQFTLERQIDQFLRLYEGLVRT